MTFDTIDEDTAGHPLIPPQTSDITAAVAQPERQAVASACRGAEVPTVFELRHRFARPSFPTGIGGTPFDRRCGIDFDPVLPQRDIDQLAYAHQQMLGLVGRCNEPSQKLFDMDSSKVLYRYIPPDERVICDHPEFQELFNQLRVLALAGFVKRQPLDRDLQPLKCRSKRAGQGGSRHTDHRSLWDFPALDRCLVGLFESRLIGGRQTNHMLLRPIAPPQFSMAIGVGGEAGIFIGHANESIPCDDSLATGSRRYSPRRLRVVRQRPLRV
ncbi:hypothetical protein RFN25_07355 [Mesorhizobium abyssinicae]|uniref:hypothetical protein n=1 Tax=Mesorhizobium abyssinicae TaxID=1209958 RepID=UPI002A242CC6|nr:hypothetical protein [Mesorhizobium abyssinicae]MDX8433249.1 hypothetical protein [Mesorhizobium abyssinicae]